MHIAIGYRWFLTAAGYHLERALCELGHTVTYVGLPCEQRPGYDSTTPVNEIISAWPEPPDLYLWIDPAGRYFPPGIEDLSVPTACYLIDVHLGKWRHQVARFFDTVFVAQKDYLEAFQHTTGHEQVHWLPLAAAPDVHRQWDLPRVYDVGFVGNIALAHRGTPRAYRLQLLAEQFHTNDFYRFYSPEEVGQVYSQSRIVFNSSIAGDVTMRVFEGTACGALVLTDTVANGLGELFEVGREIVTYEDNVDLLGQLNYYLSREEERARIARAGQQRTQAQHTYAHRVQTILDTVSVPSVERLAPMRQAGREERWAARCEIYTHLHMVEAILDGSRDAGTGSIARVWQVLPSFIRRLVI